MEIKIKKKSKKPFKSGEKINTFKGIIKHPIIGVPAFTFVEDDSFVQCSLCTVVDNPELKSFLKVLFKNNSTKAQREQCEYMIDAMSKEITDIINS